jgi:NADH-quinone oxidoreductase subunit H
MIATLSPGMIIALTAMIKIVVVIGVMLGLVSYSVYAERRISAAIQDRIGPNRVGPFGLFQPIADAMKFMLKEEYTPGNVNKLYFWLAPGLAMAPALITIGAIPYASLESIRLPGLDWIIPKPGVIADVNVGILFVFAFASLSVYGIVLAGWSSNSKYPFLGGIRSSAQMISYEISMGLSVIPIFLIIGKLNLSEIIQYQIHHGWLLIPWINGFSLSDTILWVPVMISFFIFLISAFAETNRLPFDLPESETELVGGYHTEYGAMKFALFFLGEYAAMIVISCLMVTLFLGGWSLPFAAYLNWQGEWWSVPLQAAVFLVKVACFLFFFIWVRWTLPRFRYDQLMDLGWKVFLPLALANILVTGLLLAWLQGFSL